MAFTLHRHVSDLMKALGLPEKAGEGVSSDGYVEHLQKHQTAYVTTRIPSLPAVKKLSSQAANSEAVLKKYEDLRLRNIREVDPLVFLLSEIAFDDKVKTVLRKSIPTGNEKGDEQHDHSHHNGETNGYEMHILKDKFHQQIEYKITTEIQKMSMKRCVPPGLFKFPKWTRERRHMSWDFVVEHHTNTNINVGPIGVLPKNTQEYLLIKDILYCLSGIEGDYITLLKCGEMSNEKLFRIDESADRSLFEMSRKILPLSTYYSIIIRFVEEKSNFEYGLVNHALCAAMRNVLKNYYLLIAQLESQHLQNNLSLQQLWLYLQPTFYKLKSVAAIADIMNKGDCFGGAVLTVLHERISSMIGDTHGQEMCFYLAQRASTPYFGILEKWIYKGLIADPYFEFLVEDNESIMKDELPVENSDDYWENRYTIRREQIPMFLEKVADMIFRTGKYLNVIRQCGQDIKCPNSKSLEYVAHEQTYHEIIHEAYNFASKKLLDLLIDVNDLNGRLRSVKHYFLLDQGDFIVQFMDTAEEELQKDIDDIMPTRLESLLELALRTSVVNSDKYKDDLKVELLPYDLLTQLFKILMVQPGREKEKDCAAPLEMPITGLEAFAFSYEVKWPLSLVINRKALACYQMLFRHLFYCKHVENLLGRVWTLNKVAKAYPRNVAASYSSAFALCQQMLNFIQNLDYYITLEVIEPHWQTFRSKMQKVSNVDEVIHCHSDFLDNCVKDCMLTLPELLKVLGQLIKLCVTFSNFMQEMHSLAVEAEYPNAGDSFLAPMIEETEHGEEAKSKGEYSCLQLSFKQRIAQFHTEFDKLFFELWDKIMESSINNCSTKMMNMIYRLDSNGFYARKHTSSEKI